MSFVIKDRVFEYTTTTGTGTLTLGGTKSGYQQFAVVGDGNTTYYTIVAENGDWESGIGTYTSSGSTLARTTVLSSSNSDNLVNFAAGTKEVFSSLPASGFVEKLSSSANLQDLTDVSSARSNLGVEGSPFRNRIMNGDFLVNQRYGTDAISITAPGAYYADRWWHSASQSSKMSAQTIIGGGAVGSKNYLRMKTISTATLGSNDIFNMRQSIEGNFIQDFNFGTAEAVQVTLSFLVRASQTGTYSVAFRNHDSNRSYVTTYTINAANTWEYKTITFNGDTSGTWKNDADTGLAIRFDFGSGSTVTTSSINTWINGDFFKASGTNNLITTLNATLDTTLIQLEKGGVVTPFEYLPMPDTTARCERYYQRCYANTRGYAPGPTKYIETPISFRTVMRATPTTYLFLGSRGNASSVSIMGSSIIGARHVLISAGAGDTYALQEIAAFDAEL